MTTDPSSSSSSSTRASRRGRMVIVRAVAATAAILLRGSGTVAASSTPTAARTYSSSAFVPSVFSPLSTNSLRHSVHRAPLSRAYAAGAKGRPSLDDVERISKGQAAKKRGVGSRAVCHRLNEMERKEFDLAKKLGFVQLRGTGYRRERKGSPLANIHRQLCDAMARPCIEIHRGLGADAVNAVVVDVSPLRPVGPGALDGAFAVCQALEAEVLPAERSGKGNKEEQGDSEDVLAKWEGVRAGFAEEDWEDRAIWCVRWIGCVSVDVRY